MVLCYHVCAMKTWVIVVLLAFSIVGVADTSYLTVQHYLGESVTCSLDSHGIFGGCSVVTSSKYSVVLGVPLAATGLMYYFLVLVLAAFYVADGKRKFLKALAVVTGIGFLGSLYFVYLQLFVLDAICIYCMVSALASTILFITSAYALSKSRGIHTVSPI